MKNNSLVIPSISVVAPARNEEGNIIKFVNLTVEALKNLTNDWEIIIVDDNSLDRTAEIFYSLAKNYRQLRILTNRRRLGVTSSLWKGISAAEKDIIIFLPVDLESNPKEDIPKLVKALSEGSDFAVGWRQKKKVSIIKSISTKILHYLYKFLFRLDLHDPSWIKAFRRGILEEVPGLRSDWQKFFAAIAHYKGFIVSEVKTNWYPRSHGKSNFGRFGLGRIPTSFFDLLNLWFILNFSKKPMHFFGAFGGLLFTLGFIILFYLSYLKFFQGQAIGDRPLLLFGILLILMGLQVFFTGFLAELFISTKDSSQNE